VVVQVPFLLHEGTQVRVLPEIFSEMAIEVNAPRRPYWGLERLRSRQLPREAYVL
jgi:hypothetical protein